MVSHGVQNNCQNGVEVVESSIVSCSMNSLINAVISAYFYLNVFILSRNAKVNLANVF